MDRTSTNNRPPVRSLSTVGDCGQGGDEDKQVHAQRPQGGRPLSQTSGQGELA
ncbi:MAG TPA: hypothetical protein VKF14_12700 [Candidatus Dormibacteraeota bacterium]|nr:hypothetical protein [Candidatus Dormibacteraeota bacterium]